LQFTEESGGQETLKGERRKMEHTSTVALNEFAGERRTRIAGFVFSTEFCLFPTARSGSMKAWQRSLDRLVVEPAAGGVVPTAGVVSTSDEGGSGANEGRWHTC
jgi:hypothetical protein